MKKILHLISAVLIMQVANQSFSQTLKYVAITALDDLGPYSTLFNTQNTKNDSMFVQRFKYSDFSLAGAKDITSIKGRYNNGGASGTTAMADIVIYDADGAGNPNNLLFSAPISVVNSDNGNGTTYKDITTPVTGVFVTGTFFVGIRTKGTDIVQFYVGNVGCACDNAWLYGPSVLNGGDDTWRTVLSRHASQDRDLYFEVVVSTHTFAGVDENEVNTSMYPNPVKDVLTIDTDSKVNSVKVFGMDGKEVLSFKTNEVLNVSALKKGTYVVEVSFENGNVSRKQVIKD